MSNESVAECLSHKDMRHVQVRLDYMQLYRNETKAKIIRILETWTNQKYADWYKSSLDSKEQKQAPPEEDLWITMSYEQFSLFAYGTIKHDTIKQSVDELVSIKHIERRIHPTIPYGPPQYLLNSKEVQKSLDEQEMPSLTDDLELITPRRKKHTPQEKYPQGRGKNHRGDPGKIPPAGGENSYPSNNTTKNYRDNPKKEESSAVSSETAAPAFYSSQEIPVTYADALAYLVPHGPHEGLDAAEVVKLAQKLWTEVHKEREIDSHSHADYTKLPARATPIPFAEQAKAITDRRQTDPALPVVKPSKQTSSPQSQVSHSPDVAPPASGRGTAQAGVGKRRTQEKPPAPEISPEAVRIMDDWDSLFKRPSPRTENHVKAATSLIASQPTKDDLNNVRKFCFSSNPEWYRNKGVTLQDVAKNFEKWQSLQEMPPPSQNGKQGEPDDPNIGDCGYPKLHPRRPRYA